MTGFMRLAAAVLAIYAVAACAASDCEEAIPGSKQGPGVCHIPGEPDAGHRPATGGVGMWTSSGVDAGHMPPASMQMSGERNEPDRMMSMPTGPKCGNGVFELGEICDGNCPTTCDTGNKCFTGTMVGSAATCDLKCVLREQDQCRGGDGCCPPACTADLDSDCSGSCGDGKVDEPETCENGSAKPCPTDCDDHDPCTLDMLTGTPEQCNVMCGHTPIAPDVKVKDQCCPDGANISVDADCAPKCGDGVVSAPETCDTASAKGCPTTCDDLDACTVDTLTGSADKCSVKCERKPVTTNVDGDGCCLPGATESEDSDCKVQCYDASDCPTNPNVCLQVQCASNRCTTKALTRACGADGGGMCQPDGSCKEGPRCGNGKVEAGEKCDGNCKPCDDGNPCTADTSSGSANTCDLVCKHSNAAAGTECGNGMRCDANGACKAAACGDGVVDMGEVCDGNCPTSCPPATAECKSNVLVKAGACDVQCKPGVMTAGTVCANGQGACNGYEGECIKNVWYNSCSATGGGCGNSLQCRPGSNYCTTTCVQDSQCGDGGKCLQGWCNKTCTSAGQCDEGQACLSFDIGSVCRPRPCGASASDDSEVMCPLGLRCEQMQGVQIWQCVP